MKYTNEKERTIYIGGFVTNLQSPFAVFFLFSFTGATTLCEPWPPP
jgi:hypothetical protein